MDQIGDRYQQKTKYKRGCLPGGKLNFASKPPTYKSYEGAQKIILAPPVSDIDAPLDLCLKTRRSIRRFSQTPISFNYISYLTWATAGIQRIEGQHRFRTAPSAGALYPIETYVLVKNIENVPPGLYHYFPLDHSLELIREGDHSRQAKQAALDQGMCLSAPAIFVFTAVWQRSIWKYKQRAYRYVYLDAGHMAQNLALAAAGLDLGSCAIGAIYDEEADAMLGVDSEIESTILMAVVGRPASGA